MEGTNPCGYVRYNRFSHPRNIYRTSVTPSYTKVNLVTKSYEQCIVFVDPKIIFMTTSYDQCIVFVDPKIIFMTTTQIRSGQVIST